VSNEIATRDEQNTVAATEPTNTLPAPQPTAGSTALMQWAQEADLAYQSPCAASPATSPPRFSPAPSWE